MRPAIGDQKFGPAFGFHKDLQFPPPYLSGALLAGSCLRRLTALHRDLFARALRQRHFDPQYSVLESCVGPFRVRSFRQRDYAIKLAVEPLRTLRSSVAFA